MYVVRRRSVGIRGRAQVRIRIRMRIRILVHCAMTVALINTWPSGQHSSCWMRLEMVVGWWGWRRRSWWSC